MFVRPHRSTMQMRSIITCRWSSMVGLSVGLSVTTVSHAKMAETIRFSMRRGNYERERGTTL